MRLDHAPERVLVLAGSSAPVPHTGATAETTIVAVTVPGGAMGLNGMLRIAALWSWTNSANDKIPRIRFSGLSGGVYMGGVTYTTTATLWTPHTMIKNAGAANVQKGWGSMADQTASAAAVVTGAVNTLVDTTIHFTGTLEVDSETIQLEYYLVELLLP